MLFSHTRLPEHHGGLESILISKQQALPTVSQKDIYSKKTKKKIKYASRRKRPNCHAASSHLLGLRLRDRSCPRCSLRSFLSPTADDTIMAASTLRSSEANHDGVTTERSEASSLKEASSVALYACVKAILSLGNWLSVSLPMLSMGPLAGLLRYTLSKSTRKLRWVDRAKCANDEFNVVEYETSSMTQSHEATQQCCPIV